MSRFTGVVFIAAGLAAAGYLVSGPGAEAPQPAVAQPEPVRSPVRTVTSDSPSPASVQAARAEPKPTLAPKAEIVLRPIEPPKAARQGARADDENKLSLTRDIQRELRRVGCYAGEVTGEWSPTTRQAMKTFIDRVNASLPIDEPDFILKALVQGHPGNACGTGCGPGQAMATDGRCMPAAVVAQAKRPAAVPAPAQRPQVAEAPAPRAATSTWETRVLQAPQEPATPPPGRMAIGGPSPLGAGIAGEPPLAGAIAAAQIESPRRRTAAVDTSSGTEERQQGTAAASAAAAAAAVAAVASEARRRVAAAPRYLAGPPPAAVRPPVPAYRPPVAVYRPPVAVYRAPPRRYYYAPTRERVASQAFWRRVSSER